MFDQIVSHSTPAASTRACSLSADISMLSSCRMSAAILSELEEIASRINRKIVQLLVTSRIVLMLIN